MLPTHQKKITYDPNIIAHMAKMYMVPSQSHALNAAQDLKKSLFPQHVQQQLLMKDDEAATIYNRTGGLPQDVVMQQAAEDLAKRKMEFQVSNAQKLYGQLYNTGKSYF